MAWVEARQPCDDNIDAEYFAPDGEMGLVTSQRSNEVRSLCPQQSLCFNFYQIIY